ncbi:hypothetical protein ARMGADRAFT_689315 [Armillaria gallica]|uniref:Uncharacterized protein n=1 Tax=Armillaria gallica TaxID=47427 RepID=A0A2H3CLY4_ARMGA|nr:hypothetical protein ARMGADRAFT_689315 [Armillaria gallica]
MQSKLQSSHVSFTGWPAAGDLIDTSFSSTTTISSPPAAYTPSPPSFYANKCALLLANQCLLLLSLHCCPRKTDHGTTDTMLGTATGSQDGYMRSVSTSAQSVYVYVVALGWLVVPELFCPPSRYNLVWGDLVIESS